MARKFMFHAIPHFVCYPQARKIHLNNATSNIIIGLSARECKLRIHSTLSAAFYFVFFRQIIFYHGRQTRLSLNENQLPASQCNRFEKYFRDNFHFICLKNVFFAERSKCTRYTLHSQSIAQQKRENFHIFSILNMNLVLIIFKCQIARFGSASHSRLRLLYMWPNIQK